MEKRGLQRTVIDGSWHVGSEPGLFGTCLLNVLYGTRLLTRPLCDGSPGPGNGVWQRGGVPWSWCFREEQDELGVQDTRPRHLVCVCGHYRVTCVPLSPCGKRPLLAASAVKTRPRSQGIEPPEAGVPVREN